MSEITAAKVKELREKSGAGMMDCKKALSEAGGDMDAAVDWLRKKGLSAAAKKADRVAAEGLVGAVTSGTKGAVIEVNSETDFVSRNDKFQDLVRDLSSVALSQNGDVEAVKTAEYPGKGHNVTEEMTNAIATIGENMNIRRAAALSVENGVVVSYIHNQAAEGMGKIGVLVALESAGDAAALNTLGRQIAMHIAATNPQALNRDGVDASSLEREKDVLREQARASGKPEEIIEKMIEGRLRKFYEEIVLLEQVFVMDGETKVGDVVKNAAKDAGADVTLTGYVRFVLGDGIEKEESDFASEVAEQLAG